MRYLWLLGCGLVFVAIYRAVAWNTNEFPASVKRQRLTDVIGSFVSEESRRRACLQAEDWPWC